MSETSCDRRDLRSTTGASSPTMGRILTDLEDRHWITKEERTYRLTDLGEFVAARLREFRDAMRLEQSLREVWPWLPYELDNFSIELFDDMVVSKPGPGYPYQPVERITELVREAGMMRGFGMVMLKSSNLEVFFTRSLDDLQSDYIYPPDVFKQILVWDPEAVTKAVSHSNCTVWIHDDLPLDDRCGICLFDDHVSICCYDGETGSLQATIDTGSPELVEWAEVYYERLREQAEPVGDADDLVPVEDS
ncbi:helix-turn-helix transcriptional regulator [Natronorarus salvus]